MKHQFMTMLARRTSNHSHNSMLQMLEDGRVDSFVTEFIEGVAHQAHIQGGQERPIGETTANRMREHLLAFGEAMYDLGKSGSLDNIELMESPRPEINLNFNFESDPNPSWMRHNAGRPPAKPCPR